MARSPAPPIDRRTFLRRIGTAGAGAAVLTSVPGAVLAANPTRKVYRLSWRGQVCCTACKRHTANRFFRTLYAAQTGRPHVACNCRILTQRIPLSQHRQYFGGPAEKPRDEFDLRWE